MFNHPFFYKKKLFRLLELYGALIRDGKARTFQSAIKLVRLQGEEPKSIKLVVEEIERTLISGETLEVALAVSLIQGKDLEKYSNELEFIKNSAADTWQYSNFANKNQDWGGESKPGDCPNILDSKICQLCFKIMIRALQEKAEAIIVDLSCDEEYFASEIHMIIEGVKREVFNLPASLIHPVLNTYLGLADLPYWKEEEISGCFGLLAEGIDFSGKVHLKREEKELWIYLDPEKHS